MQILFLKLKCTKLDFSWGSALDPAGELTTPPQTRKERKTGEGRKIKGRGKQRGGTKGGREKEGKRVEAPPPIDISGHVTGYATDK